MLHIIDDEEVIRDALSWLAASRQIKHCCYESAEKFLAQFSLSRSDATHNTAPEPCAATALVANSFASEGDCLLLDIRMPGMSGIALFEHLKSQFSAATGLRLPVIFLTGHGDVPLAVDTLKRGAFDFFEKPFNDNSLMDRVLEALEASRAAAAQAAIHERLSNLSLREREVLELILNGKMNKQIADQLNISMRTVEVHRAHIFEKMQVKTAVELARQLK